MAFKFKLAAVLKKYEHEERQVKERLAGHQQTKFELEERNRLMEEEIQRALHSNRAPNPVYDELRKNFISNSRNQILFVNQKIEQVNRFIEDAQKDLQRARINTRSMEILKDKHYEAYKKELAKKEQATFDEIATMRGGQKTPF